MSAPLRRPTDYRPRDLVPVRRALISVSDKTGLDGLAAALIQANVEVVSTGSTAQYLRQCGVSVRDVADLTGYAEALDGRVKTLHPAIHGGILADLRLADHERELNKLGISPFELVVVNLYPFAETLASGAPPTTVIENIDIGGPAMVRAAAKNHANVAIVVSPASYPELAEALAAGGTTLVQRTRWAAAAFAQTAEYDAAIWGFMQDLAEPQAASPAPAHAGADEVIGPTFRLGLQRVAQLRYGENAHQSAAIYRQPGTRGIADARQLGGKDMSYNNYVDADAAVRAAYDVLTPGRVGVAIIKHANPCGVALAATGAEAHRLAHACDPVSAFGGVIAVTEEVDPDLARSVSEIFTEVIVAPGYSPDALEILSTKPNLRILELAGTPGDTLEFRSISGGALVQQADRRFAPVSTWTLVAGQRADSDTLESLEFAWRACRAVKSNAILLARGMAAVGVGMGQVNRVDSARLAVTRAGQRAHGAVCASDAFFPFADGIDILAQAGVRAVVQPGGSMRDTEVIERAASYGMTMYLTGERHFFH